MPYSAPKSVLILGSGVFGLSTAEALIRRSEFAQSTITVVDRGSDGDSPVKEGDNGDDDDERHFPARDAASIDSSRIVRADYADPAYAALAAEAQAYWRGTKRRPTASSSSSAASRKEEDDYIGGNGRYTESGLVVVADRATAEAPAPADAGSEMMEPSKKKKKTGMDYVRESWANVQAMAAEDPSLADSLQELPDAEAIRAAVGTGGSSGDWGYLNRASGWADAAASMAWVLRRVRQTGRVRFVRGRVVEVEVMGNAAGAGKDSSGSATATATGVRLADGRRLEADLVIAATGAWTASLLGGGSSSSNSSSSSGLNGGAKLAGSVHGALAATGQVLGYVPLATADEHARVARMPVVLNLSSGLFVIPPAPHSRELKIARHAYGYINVNVNVNPSVAAETSVSTSSSSSSPVSRPLTHLDEPNLTIPAEGAADLRRGLRQMVPLPELVARPFSKTRLCWYTDTPSGDFLVDYHPSVGNLFLATGGSGHAFKFLPVIGDKVVDCIMGERPAAFREKWAWKPQQNVPSSEYSWMGVVTEDGSRGGRPGLILREELAKIASS